MSVLHFPLISASGNQSVHSTHSTHRGILPAYPPPSTSLIHSTHPPVSPRNLTVHSIFRITASIHLFLLISFHSLTHPFCLPDHPLNSPASQIISKLPCSLHLSHHSIPLFIIHLPLPQSSSSSFSSTQLNRYSNHFETPGRSTSPVTASLSSSSISFHSLNIPSSCFPTHPVDSPANQPTV